MCAPAQASFARERSEVLRLLEDERRAQQKIDRMDAGDREKRARELIDRAAARAADDMRPRELHAVAEKFGRRTVDFQKEQLDRQVRQAMGVSLTMIERPVRDLIPLFATANVELVKTVPERYFDRLARDVQDAFESGMHPDTLAEKFIDDDGALESDARRIARDQIGRLAGQVNQERQESLGITSYIWRGALDSRERDEHVEREGQQFDWDDPPEDGNPGEPVMCRCTAEPVLDDILQEISE